MDTKSLKVRPSHFPVMRVHRHCGHGALSRVRIHLEVIKTVLSDWLWRGFSVKYKQRNVSYLNAHRHTCLPSFFCDTALLPNKVSWSTAGSGKINSPTQTAVNVTLRRRLLLSGCLHKAAWTRVEVVEIQRRSEKCSSVLTMDKLKQAIHWPLSSALNRRCCIIASSNAKWVKRVENRRKWWCTGDVRTSGGWKHTELNQTSLWWCCEVFEDLRPLICHSDPFHRLEKQLTHQSFVRRDLDR